MHLDFKSNEYADLIKHDVYDHIPKTVMAALAVSFAIHLEGQQLFDSDLLHNYLMEEWKTLYRNKIVPQKPPKY